MERAVFVIAIVAAIIFALGHFIGAGVFTFHADDGKWQGVGEWGPPEAVLPVSAGRHEPTSYVAGDIEIKHAAVRVVIVPEARQDVQIEIDNPGKTPMPEISLENGRLVVDGHLRGRIASCDANSADLTGYGRVALEEMPLVTIRAPMDLDMDIGGAGSTQIGPSAALDLTYNSCGPAQIADVAGDLDLDVASQASVTAGAAGSLDLDFAGSGLVETGAIAQGAEVSVAGSGKTRLASLAGPLDFDGAGSGEMWIGEGALTSADISLGGSGRFELASGSVTRADLSIAGSGEIRFGGPVETLNASLAGSGSVFVAGEVGAIDANIMGSGNVDVGSLTGTLNKSVMGSGEVRVGGQPRG